MRVPSVYDERERLLVQLSNQQMFFRYMGATIAQEQTCYNQKLWVLARPVTIQNIPPDLDTLNIVCGKKVLQKLERNEAGKFVIPAGFTYTD